MKTREVFFYVLGTIVVLGFFSLVSFLIFRDTNREAVNLCIGALLSAFGTVVGYFYGSSKGSAEKNEMLKQK